MNTAGCPMLRATYLAALVVASACISVERTAPEISRWLHCEECSDGEREAVRALGASAVPELRRALLEGPRAAERNAMTEQYRSAHRTVPDPSRAESDYVGTLLEAYVATYQGRAVVGLADIGGSAARQALEEALARPSTFRRDVLDAARVAIGSFEAERFNLRAAPENVAFGDTLTLSRPAGPRFTSAETISVESAIYPDSLVRVLTGPDSLRFVVTALPGERVLAVKDPSNVQDSSLAIITVRTLSDANDRHLGSCASLSCLVDSAPRLVGDSGRATQFLSLWRARSSSDTVDVFRITPSQVVSVAVFLDWRPSGQLDLVWERCSDGNRLRTVGGLLLSPSPGRLPTPALPAVGMVQTDSGPGIRAALATLPAGCFLLKVMLTSPQAAVIAARLHIYSVRGAAGIRPEDLPSLHRRIDIPE
jgi:hypothetical protein